MTTATRRADSTATRFGAWLARPLASFHLIVTIATLLTVLGLVMVLSASSVEAYADGGSAYSLFVQQAMFAGIGLVLFYLALRIPLRRLRQWSFPIFALSVLALLLVLLPGIGSEVQGARRWLVLGPISIQPSEVIKVSLVVWGAHLLASRRSERATLKELLVPLVPAGLLVCLLVVLQPNLSTTIALGIVLMALLWFGGLPARLFVTIAASGVVAAVVLALSAGYRSDRMRAFFNPGDDPQGIGYQARQAMYSLADGGIWGRGLGQSRAKWSYLPNSHNDFIFAIIGEELGFLGCMLVLGLFALFVFTGLRIATRSVDPFLKILIATATTWITSQALINIGYVVGLLPVTGLQLPLVSAGGSSLAITLFMFGIIANAARHEPEAVSALNAGQDGRVSRLLRLPKPEVYSPVRAEQARARSVNRRGPGRPPNGRGGVEGERRRRTDAGLRRGDDSGLRRGHDSGPRRGDDSGLRPADLPEPPRRRSGESRGTGSLRATRAWEPSYPMPHARERGRSR
ncbi:putative lipid II flippase FtsW [Nocardia harenae]|uniref:putative lipid II flippase FtsW n=1 Tax=Nocardia harenae TaxID=358707 RepID=UPI00082A7952|nr:putative lipid II flippase FtsW [Nocardia harenae]